MNNYIEDLYEAFKNVDTSFYSTESIKLPESFFNDLIPKATYIQQTELHFSTELYAEWRQIIKSKDNGYDNLKIGFETSKKFVKNIFIADQKTFKPDLILHQSQIDFQPDLQKIYIEVKTNNSLNAKKILHDIKKIVFAMKQYEFQNGVFISLNCKIDRLLILIAEVKIKVENLTQKNETELWDNIYLFYGKKNGIKQILKFNDPSISLYPNFECLKKFNAEKYDPTAAIHKTVTSIHNP